MSLLRLCTFIIILISLILVERILPKRKQLIKRSYRWTYNFSLIALGNLLAHISIAGLPLAASFYCTNNQIGIIPASGVSSLVAPILSYFALDALIYFQHRVLHHVPLFWRFHKVHHSDIELDVTSGFRFHPVEIIASILIKVLGVVLIGAHPMGVLVFEILLNAGSLFNHSNISIGKRVDSIVRWFIVTPDMHLIHHSTKTKETNSNFSFTISIWDRIFGTYQHRPENGYNQLVIGLDEYRDSDELGFVKLLKLPFEKPKASENSPAKN